MIRPGPRFNNLGSNRTETDTSGQQGPHTVARPDQTEGALSPSRCHHRSGRHRSVCCGFAAHQVQAALRCGTEPVPALRPAHVRRTAVRRLRERPSGTLPCSVCAADAAHQYARARARGQQSCLPASPASPAEPVNCPVSPSRALWAHNGAHLVILSAVNMPLQRHSGTDGHMIMSLLRPAAPVGRAMIKSCTTALTCYFAGMSVFPYMLCHLFTLRGLHTIVCRDRVFISSTGRDREEPEGSGEPHRGIENWTSGRPGGPEHFRAGTAESSEGTRRHPVIRQSVG